MKILFLYSELGPYNEIWFNELLKLNYELTVVYWDKNLIKPELLINKNRNITWIPRSTFDFNNLVDQKWRLIYVSGWMDLKYLRFLTLIPKETKRIIGIDDVYTGSLKQSLLSLFGKIIISKLFTNAWVAGFRQYEYARRLGFKHENIVNEMLVANQVFNKCNYDPSSKAFLYVGSLREIKGVRVLIDAFKKYRKNGGHWDLILVGNNVDFDIEFLKYDGIINVGIVPNNELVGYFDKSSVFIMPGLHEQWGVSLHEATLAGMPIISSTAVGSSSHLVINNYNGFIYDGGIDSLLESLIITSNKSKEDLLKMGVNSRLLASRILPETSIANLISIL